MDSNRQATRTAIFASFGATRPPKSALIRTSRHQNPSKIARAIGAKQFIADKS